MGRDSTRGGWNVDRKIARAAALQLCMGDLLPFRPRSAPRPAAPAVFSFDVASPWTYVAAERVDRGFADVRWRPAAHPAGADVAVRAHERARAGRRAAELGLPLVWPERAPSGRAATRIAVLAAAQGRAAAFTLAAARLAFCGGFDLDDPEVLAEAAAAASLGLGEAMAAARDARADGAARQEGMRVARLGARALPVLQLGSELFCGEHRIAEARAAAGWSRAGRAVII
jgi:2-hydroxychromene-2-carboxylate isomerase